MLNLPYERSEDKWLNILRLLLYICSKVLNLWFNNVLIFYNLII